MEIVGKSYGSKAFAASQYQMEREYWLSRMEGFVGKTIIPYDFNASTAGGVELDSVTIELPPPLVEKLLEASAGMDHRLLVVLLTGLLALLHRYLGTDDMTVAIPVPRQKTDGELLNATLLLRNRVTGDCSFRSLLLEEVRKNLSEAENHQNYPLEILARQLELSRAQSGSSFFDIVMLLEPLHDISFIKEGLGNVVFAFGKDSRGISGTLYFNPTLYRKRRMEETASHYRTLLAYALNEMDTCISQLPILTDLERKRLLVEFNATTVDYPHHLPVHRIFSDVAHSHPGKIAVTYRHCSLTYRELWRRSIALAGYLRSSGVEEGDIVGIDARHSCEIIIGLLGILHSGAAYLPANPALPPERKQFLASDSGLDVWLDAGVIAEAVSGPAPADCDFTGTSLDSMALAYVMYTSGSTGRPKGVMVCHRSVVRLVKNTDYICFKPNDRILQTGALDFDASTFEIWGALLNGLGLFLVSKDSLLQNEQLNVLIQQYDITTMWMTSPLFNQMVECDPSIFGSLSYLLVGGDVLSLRHINRIRNQFPHISVINGYGPTENTTFSTAFPVDSATNGNIPIGRPIANSTAYIVDTHGRPVPVGIPGELWVGGDGVATGYLNNPDMTVRRFSPNPFNDTGAIFKTGDYARWLPGGIIEFIGRIDNQVKIRGFRIETGEIVNGLMAIESIKEAVVAVKDSDGEKYLCAYFVADEALDVGNIRRRLSETLPPYMIPGSFVQVDEFTLNLNGKIDMESLPEPGAPGEEGYIAPRNSMEEALEKIWAEVLTIPGGQVSVDANFFEIGGHSLKATILLSRIHKELSVKIPLTEIFGRPTIRELAVFIEGFGSGKHSAIPAVEKMDYYPLSSAQKRLFVLAGSGGNSNYNVPMAFHLEGEINRLKLEDTLDKLVQRHQSLRTSFHLVDDEPVQRVHSNSGFSLNFQEAYPAEVRGMVNAFIRPFRLGHAPLFRALLIKTTATTHVLVMDFHHIITDGTSMAVFVRDFIQLYQGRPLQPLDIQYTDYAIWQERVMEEGEHLKQEKFWLDTFQREIPLLELPYDRKRPLTKDFQGGHINFRFEKELASQCLTLASSAGATGYMILLAMFVILLSKISRQEDIVVGSPVAGRRHADLEPVMGMFVNTLAMRCEFLANDTFTQFLGSVKAQTLSAFENQDYQFEDLVERLDLRRDPGRNPLFDVMFSFHNEGDNLNPEMHLPELAITGLDYDFDMSKFDMTLNAEVSGDDIVFQLQYSKALFDESTILRFAGYLRTLATAVVEDPHRAITEIPIIPQAELHEILYTFNDTRTPVPVATVTDLFDAQARRSANLVAVVEEELHVTYDHLDRRTHPLACQLRRWGTAPDSIVGLLTGRSIARVEGMLAILKAGGAYLPLTPSIPTARKDLMLRDCGGDILVCQQDYRNDAQTLPVRRILELGDGSERLPAKRSLPPVNHPHHLAYIIYTSGSTGKPKGVMVEHRNVVNVVSWFGSVYNLGHFFRVLQLTDFSFDPSVNQIVGSLLFGATLCVPPDHCSSLARYIERQQIQLVNAVPSVLRDLLCRGEGLPSVELALSGGEELDDYTRREILRRGYQLHNQYGPSEATIDALAGQCSGQPVTLGRPIANTRCYILDDGGEILPIGVPGQLAIAGAGLCRGYLNNPEVTIAAFSPVPSLEEERLYHTGDCARFLPDGTVEFFGRLDSQVKIRGHRVEPGEIEACLRKLDGVSAAAVKEWRYSNGETYLCAYVESRIEAEEGHWRRSLEEFLPNYMIPASFVDMEEIPRTVGGKVDSSRLPEPGTVDVTVGRMPRDTVELKLLDMWARLLSLDPSQLDIDRDFFQSGGHSLRATILIARIHQEFDVNIPLSAVFSRPTIAGMADVIRSSAPERFVSMEPSEKQDYYSLTSGQRRLLVLQELDPTVTAYNMPFIVRMQGALHRTRLERAMMRLIHRHDSLRTSFHMMEEQAIQKVSPQVDFQVEYFDIRDSDDTEAAGIELARQFVRPFSPSVAPLIRAGLVRLEERDFLFMVDTHHMIADGQSHAVLLREFTALYNDEDLPPLRLQYRDYAQWLAGETGLGHLKKQEDFWLGQFTVTPPALNLPLDFSRPPMQSFEGSMETVVLEPRLANSLRSHSQQNGSTVFMTVLALFYILLSKLSGQEDITVGTPVLGRRHADLEAMIGMFVNTLPLRGFPIGSASFCQFLEEVRNHTLSAFENQEYPFEDLVEQVAPARDISRNPLFDVMFSFYTADTPVENNRSPVPGVTVVPFQLENTTSKFDLSLYAEDNHEGIVCSFEYCTRLFTAATIRRFGSYFLNIAEYAATEPDQPISHMEWLSPEEKELILEGFNRTSVHYADGKSLQNFFVDAASAYPSRIALRFGSASVSYGRLQRHTLCLARRLKSKGCGPASLVGIMMDRSLEMMAGILAILRVGGGYVPIDPSIPEERRDYILKDSALGVLLEKGAIKDSLSLNFTEEADDDLLVASSSTDPAYCIYTSGSTGRPKGVLVERQSVVNILQTLQTRYPLGADDCYLLKTPVVFDVSVTELFGWFMGGGSLCILPSGDEKDPDAIVRAIGRHRVSHINFVPSMFSAFLEMLDQAAVAELSSLRYCFLAGEALTASTVNAFRASGITALLENIYGPTEATVYATGYSLEQWEGGDVPIGKPLDNVRIRILDRYGRTRGINMSGELVIAGAGLARGYLNRVELTHTAFGVDCSADKERWYRSGDLARWRPNGDIEYLGRVDHQVKIRGNRIELGEIEAALLEHQDVLEVVAAVIDEASGGKSLAAYVRGLPEDGISELAEHLKRLLPSYMIPAYFVPLEEFPRNSAGKIDRLNLPPVTDKTSSGIEEDDEPATPLEAMLAEAWGHILGRDRVGVHDNFFALGGDSIKTIQIAGRVRRQGYRMAMADIFRNPTIRQLAAVVKKISRTPSQQPVIGPCPLTPIQEQFFQSGRAELHYYNQAVMLYSEQPIEEELVSRVFGVLQTHHDALRMTFHSQEGRIVQFCRAPGMPVSLEVFDFTGLPEATQMVTAAATGIQGKIDLEGGPLMRLGLFRLDDGDRLLIVVHHLVIDGVSWRILFEDIDTLIRQYRGGQALELQPKTDSFKYWGEALSRYAEGETLRREIDYWRELEARGAGNIQRDFDAGPNLVKDGALASRRLSAEDTELLLSSVHEAFNTEIEDILLTAIGLAIRESFGCRNILLALEGHGREEVVEDVDVVRTVGWFTSLYPVVLALAENQELGSCVKQVKETLRRIPHKGIGYGVTRYLASPELRDGVEFLLQPQVIFNYLGQFDEDVRQMTGLRIAAESPGPFVSSAGVRPYDLDISGMVSGGVLSVSVSYNRTHFESSTIEKFSVCFLDHLRKIIVFCTEKNQKELTPSDLTYKGLSLDALQEIDNMFG